MPSSLTATFDKFMFKHNWEKLRDKLSELLPSISKRQDHLLTKRLLSSRSHYEKGNKRIGCAEACYVQFILEDLELIRSNDQNQFKCFQKKLRRNGVHEDTYFGIRLEIRTSASLFKKNVVFIKSETPDFIINDLELGIECTNVHISLTTNSKPNEVLYKIQSAIKHKNDYKYRTDKTILFIDASNLLFHEGNEYCNKVLADKDNSYPILVKNVNNSNFMSVMYFTYSWIPVQGSNGATLHNLYNRIDNGKIDKCIKTFLDTHFPLGDLWVEGHLRCTV